MSSRVRTQALLLSIRDAIRDVVHPERAGDAGTRRAFADEARESNAHTVRWVVLFLGPLHAIVIAVALSLHETEPARVAWLSWLTGINALLLGAGMLGAFVAWRCRPAALFRALGDVGGAVYLLGTAAISANAQRAHSNVSVFVIAAFFTGFRLRMRPPVYLLSLLAGVALLMTCMARFRSETALRATDYVTLLAVASLSLFAFFLTRGMRFRELQARCQVQELNAQLNEKIRERSRELSMALARLAEGHRELDPGTVLGGRVELEASLGRGGMGIVYRGHDLLTGKAVAVKVVQAGSTHELDELYRFLREARIVASVTHPAIVRSIHVDVSEDGRLFQMMELVEGETLAAHLSRAGVLSPPVAARLGAVLAEALATAHQAGVVHLDVKPSNVILSRTKPGLKLLDFGISRLRDVRATSGGAEGRIVGTPEFLSPEQVNHPSSVDDRADVYALGLVLYMAMAGRMPFDASSPPEWVLAHGLHAPHDLQERVPGIDPEIARVVMSCLRKDPDKRPAASAVAAMLGVLAETAKVPPLEALDLGAPADAAPPGSQVRPVLAGAAAVAASATTRR
jgi:eukaryotic-like serine/threonine-protein kinase